MKSVLCRYAAAILVAASLHLTTGCSLMQPTYMDISPEQLDLISERLGTTTEKLYREDRALLKTELTEVIGLKVDAIELPDIDIPSGASPEDIVALMKAEGVVAKIEPASSAAFGAVASEGLKNPVSKEGWVTGGIAGLGVLIAGALGLRGRKRRRGGGVGPPRVRPVSPPRTGTTENEGIA